MSQTISRVNFDKYRVTTAVCLFCGLLLPIAQAADWPDLAAVPPQGRSFDADSEGSCPACSARLTLGEARREEFVRMTVTIRQGFALEVLPTLAAGSVHCCVTSPPYWGLRDYGIPPSVWGGAAACDAWGEAVVSNAAGYEVGEKARWNHRTNGRGEVQERILAKDEVDAGWTRKDVVQGQFCACGAWLGALGLEPTPELYVAHCVTIFRAVRRVFATTARCG